MTTVILNHFTQQARHHSDYECRQEVNDIMRPLTRLNIQQYTRNDNCRLHLVTPACHIVYNVKHFATNKGAYIERWEARAPGPACPMMIIPIDIITA